MTRLPENDHFDDQSAGGPSTDHAHRRGRRMDADGGGEVIGTSVTELARDTAGVVREAERGRRVIVHRRGRPVAVLLSIEAGIDAVVPHVEEMVRLRREAHEKLRDEAAIELAEVVAWTPRWR